MKAKYLMLFVVLLVVSVSASALAAPFDPETFVYISGAGSPQTLDPAAAYDTASGEVIHQIYDNLFEYVDGDLDHIGPVLATEVPSVANGLMSEDGRTVRVPIRKGVKFHNGADLTPEDVKYTLIRNMLADPAGGPQWMFFEPLLDVQTMADVVAMVGGPESFVDIDEVDAAVLLKAYEKVASTIEVDGDDIVFHLANAYPPFINILTKGGSWGAVLNKDWMIANGAWDGNPETWSKWYDLALEDMTCYEKANGTGPFRLETWDKSGSQTIYSRFDEYWQGPAKIKTAFIKDIKELSTRVLMLRAGDADGIYVGQDELEQVRDLPGVVVLEGLPQMTNTVLFYSFTIPTEGNEDLVGSGKLDGKGIPSDFFADVDIRKAFNYAFDYEAYLNEVAQGAGVIPKGAVPQVLPFVNPDQEYYNHDLKKAEEHFKKAFGGEVWEKGFEVGIVYNTGNDQRKTALEILEYNIKSINPKFKVNVVGLEWATVLDKLRSASLPVFVLGWLADFPDPHNFTVPFMHSSGTFAGYCGQGLIDLAKEEFDELIDAGIKATDPAEREAIYYDLQERYVDLAISLPFIEATTHRVMRDWVQNFIYTPAYSANFDFYTVYKEEK
ncbi:MAG: ABC transporter substrate-binding protein [Firmicutes bacterium]|nr:ABC transporter substrate-binding protein [Bacillota bacterium]